MTDDQSLPVAVDAMGGDLGPMVVIEGALQAARELGIRSILVGPEDTLRSSLSSLGGQNQPGISICHASQVIEMTDSPATAIRAKRDSSLERGYQLVESGEASALVSAGNTGAMMAIGVLVCGTLPGIVRPAIASLIPKVGDSPPSVLLDSGANVDCNATQLVQFAVMGSFYARLILPCELPRVALLSNGSESSKGTDVLRSAAVLLGQMPQINYVGYIEGRDISRSAADVVVCDGFVGNIVLKAMEGAVELVFDSIRFTAENSGMGRLGMWLAQPMFKSLFQDKLDPSAYGGAPLLGLRSIAIVCHGSSNSRAIMNGIRVAKKSADQNLVEAVSTALSTLDSGSPGSYEDGLWRRMSERFDKKKVKRSAKRSPSLPSEKGDTKL